MRGSIIATRPDGIARHGVSTVWIMLFTASSTALTLLLACATPFLALATLAAVHMHRRAGIALMLAAWLASQLVGFCLLGYPHDPRTLAWSLGIGTAAVAAVLGAGVAIRSLCDRPMALRLAVAQLAGFAAFKAVLLAWALPLGGVAIAIDLALAGEQLLGEGAALIGLQCLYRAMTAIGVPAADRGQAMPV